MVAPIRLSIQGTALESDVHSDSRPASRDPVRRLPEELPAMAKATRAVGAVPGSRFSLFRVYYTRTPKKQANGSGQTFLRPGEAGRAREACPLPGSLPES